MVTRTDFQLTGQLSLFFDRRRAADDASLDFSCHYLARMTTSDCAAPRIESQLWMTGHKPEVAQVLTSRRSEPIKTLICAFTFKHCDRWWPFTSITGMYSTNHEWLSQQLYPLSVCTVGLHCSNRYKALRQNGIARRSTWSIRWVFSTIRCESH